MAIISVLIKQVLIRPPNNNNNNDLETKYLDE